MLEFLTIQVLSICFAILCGVKDWMPVLKFENHGVSKEENRVFHLSGAWQRFVFCASVPGVAYPDWLDFIFFFAVSGLWVYLLFDITLSKLRRLKWWYIGTNDGHGSFWIGLMGKYAGIYKAVILLLLIAATNVFFFIH